MAESVEMVQCACVANGPPLWGYCEDDLFCPLCGDRVAQLKSTQELNDPHSPLLIYNQPDTGYSFPLTMEYGGQDRTLKSRTPLIDSEKSSLAPQTYFTTRLGVPPAASKGARFYCWLIPREDLDGSRLPNRGLDSEVTLVGDFGRVQFPVLICNFPEIVVELSGRGIDYDKGMNWKVWRDEILELEFRLRATNAPVIIEEETELVVNDADALARGLPQVTALLKDRLRKDARLVPEEGEYPAEEWSTTMRLDARSVGKPDRNCQLIFPIDLLGIDAEEPLVLNLTYVDSGRLEFSPATLTISQAYLGEVRSNALLENPEPTLLIPKWYIANIGQQDITVRISGRDAEAEEERRKTEPKWLYVDWAAPQDTDDESVRPNSEGEVTLRRGEQAQLYVRIDLRGFNPQSFKNGTALLDEVILTDDRDMPWRARVRLNRVVRRTTENAPSLAIDFGNTHSFAAMWNPGEMPKQFEHDEIIPVHDLRRPDAFPTAIYFENVSNPSEPVYHIGFEAIERGAANQDGMVIDLKRWIGKGGEHHYRNVVDRLENAANYDIETLVVMYLRALIKQSENVIRKYEIRKLGISYPSKFGPERRRAFDRILAQLVAGSADLPPVELVTGGAAIDEANAAVISCVLSAEFQQQHVDLLERGRFSVAAVDWGGGSLDTAVLEFLAEGQTDNPIFTSHYLAIGGDEFFGGDNMTVSVMELLIDKLTEILAEVLPPDAWERLVHPPAGKDSGNRTQRRNFNALWLASEKIKQFQSNHWQKAPGAAAREQLRATLRKLLLENFKYRLPNRPDARSEGPPDDERNDAAADIVAEAINQDQLLIDLELAWKRPIRADFEGDGKYSIEGRFRQHLKQLMASASRGESGTDEPKLDVLVLCGSASRLPLVEPLVREVCPGVEIINDPVAAKRRVAYGIVRYVDAHWNDHDLARSSDYTNAAFGLVPGGARNFIRVIPECSPVLKPELCYPFLQQGKNKGQPLELGPFMQKDDAGRKVRLDVYREGSHRQGIHGYFDLSHPPIGAPQRPDALDSGLPITGYLRLNGSESKIELFLEIDSITHGPWPLIPKVPEH